MRKVFLVLVLLAAAGVGVFLFLGKVLTESELKSRIKELVREANVIRNPYSIREANLQNEFFDIEAYDQGGTHPLDWVEIWKAENESQMHHRQLDTFVIIDNTKTEANIEFTLQEGFAGSDTAKSDMKPVKYVAKMIYMKAKEKWVFKSLKYAGQ